MAAQHTYTVGYKANGDLGDPIRDDDLPVPLSDPDFLAWNAALPTPFVFSQRQQLMQQLKTLTMTQWTNGTVTAAQKDKVLFYLMKKMLEDESE